MILRNKNVLLTLIVVLIAAGLFLLTNNTKQSNDKLKRARSSSSPKAGLEVKKARAEYFFNMLRDPATNSIPTGIRERELEFQKRLPISDKSFRKSNNISAFDWKQAGPNDVGGRTRALAVDVNNSYTVLAGGVSGGIWKTTDNGTTWKLKSSSVNDLSVTYLVQDRRSGHTNNWYYCSGEIYGNSASARGWSALFRGGGVYKSTDNGDTWNRLASTASNPAVFDSYFDYVSKIEINPSTGSVFLASNFYGIIRSTDGGNNFNLVLGGVDEHYYSDVVVNSNGVLIASISEYIGSNPKTNPPGIYKSTNDGANWTNITPSNFPAAHQRTVMAVAPSNPNILYTFTYTGGTDSFDEEELKFFKINIASGVSEDRSANLPDFRTSGVTYAAKGFLTTQGNYNMALAVKPDNENFVLIGGTCLFRSYDGFATKPTNVAETWIGGYGQEEFIHPNNHPDQHVLAFDPQAPNVLWNGHDGGISRSSNILNSGYGAHFPWGDKNAGYNVTQFYTLSIPYISDDKRIMGGTQDNGTPYFSYPTTSTLSSDISSGDGAYCYFGTGVYAYVSIYDGRILRLGYDALNKPNDRISWSWIKPTDAEDQLFVNPFIVDHSNNNIMYYLAGDDIWRNNSLNSIEDYQDDGTTVGWSNIYTRTGYTFTTLNVSRGNPSSTLYAGAYKSNDLPIIYRLDNATTSTSAPVNISVPGADVGSYPHNIAVNPDNGNEIIVIFSNYNVKSIYHSTDGGGSYANIEGNLSGDAQNPGPSIRCASILPSAAGSLYMIGTSIGIYVTTMLDGVNTVWTQEGSSTIGNTVVAAIESRKLDGRIAVATHGRGIFVADNVVVGVEKTDNDKAEFFTLEQNYPNPFNPSTVIRYNLPEASNVILKIFDISGREVKTLVNSRQSSGQHSTTFNAGGLASGVYIYTLQAGSLKESKKMMLTK
jgi:hypothetical protein